MARQNKRPADVRIETQRRLTARGMRSPVYNHRRLTLPSNTIHFMNPMPVLAGDTVKSFQAMGRILGTPTTTALQGVQGSWFEFWLFYVRVGDLPTEAENLRQFLSGAAGTGPSWATIQAEGWEAIWKGYFADEEEGSASANGFRLRFAGTDWLDTLTLVSALPPPDPVNNDAWEEAWVRYQAMRRAKLTTNTFEEYLAKQGIAAPPTLREEHDPERKMPELLHYSREFAYPQPTTNPTGTALAHAIQWFKQERMTRSRFCAEPGWLFPAIAVRPKVLLGGPGGAQPSTQQPESLVPINQLFQPPELDTDPHTSLVEVAGLYSPSGDSVAGAAAVVDTRDALLYGYDSWNGNGAGLYRTLDRRPTAAQVTAMPTYTVDFMMRPAIASRISRDTTA